MFQDRVQRIIDNIDQSVAIAKSTSAQMIFVEIGERVFTRGQDVNNSQIGTYSERYLKEFENGGRVNGYRKKQLAFVDLTLSTALNKSIMNGEDRVYFKNDYGTTVGRGNEDRYDKKIFSPTEKERQIYFNNLDTEIQKLFSGNN